LSENGIRIPSLRDAFLIVFLGFTAALAVQLLGGTKLGKWGLLLGTVVMVLPALLFAFLRPFPFRTTFRWRRTDVRCLAAAGLVGLGMGPAMDELDRLIQRLIPMSPDLLRALESAVRFQTIPEMLILVAAMVVAAPFAEEMLFRGLLQGTLERTGNVNKAVLSTSLLFTAIHFNPWWTVEILITGVFLGVLTWRTNSIFPAIVLHAVNNVLSFILINTDPQRLQWYTFRGHIAPHWIALGILLAVIGFKWTYRVTQEEHEGKNG